MAPCQPQRGRCTPRVLRVLNPFSHPVTHVQIAGFCRIRCRQLVRGLGHRLGIGTGRSQHVVPKLVKLLGGSARHHGEEIAPSVAVGMTLALLSCNEVVGGGPLPGAKATTNRRL